MTALQALQQARLDTSKYARPVGAIKSLRFIESTWNIYRKVDGKPEWQKPLDILMISNLINDDGSSVEWEIVSESEL